MKNIKKNLRRTVAAISAGIMSTAVYGRAAGIDDIVKPLTNLRTLLSTVATGMGGVWLLWSLIQFAFAFNQNDPGSKQSALKGIVAGGILLSAGLVLTFIMS